VSVIGVKTIIKISEPVTDYSFFDANCAKPLKFMWQSRGFNRVNLKATFLCSNRGRLLPMPSFAKTRLVWLW